MKDYKRILEDIVNIVNTTEKSDIGFDNIRTYIGENCPELQESEDERIRKELIDAIQGLWDNDALPMPLSVKRKDSWLAWLEKQGEQRSTAKVEPKFKVGDWCIDNEDGTIFQIVKVLDNTYTYKTNEGKEYSCTHYSLENDARLLTIQDAKNCDVLVSPNGALSIIASGKKIN